jgi:hypothetical protein
MTSPMDTSPLPGDDIKAAPAGFTAVSSSHVQDSSGAVVTNATIYFQPCDTQGKWMSYQVNGAGQAIWQATSAPVVNGAFSVDLADTSLTKPQNICYLTTIVDNVTGAQLLGPGYLIQPSGPSWNFDVFIPNNAPLAIIQVGPPGPPNSLAIGTVTTLAPLSPATASITGAAPAQTLNLGIPAGPAGGTGGAFGTTVPLPPTAAGAVGTQATSSRSDHQHPSELSASNITLPGSLIVEGATDLWGGLTVVNGETVDVLTVPTIASSPLVQQGMTVQEDLTVGNSATTPLLSIGSTKMQPLLGFGPLPTALDAFVDQTGATAHWTDSAGVMHFEAGIVLNGERPISIPQTSPLPMTLTSPPTIPLGNVALALGPTLLQTEPTLIPYGDVVPLPLLSDIDATGFISRYLDAAGVYHFTAGIALPLSQILQQLGIGSGTALKPMPLPNFGNKLNTSFAVADAIGAMAAWVDPTGGFNVGGNLTVLQAAAALSLLVTNGISAGNIKATGGYNGALTGVAGMQGIVLPTGEVITALVVQGRSNIYKVGTQSPAVITQLTTLGQSIPLGLSSTGQVIFGTDRSGAHEIWTMNTDGSNQARYSSVIPNLPATVGFLIIGQSNAEGMESYPLINDLSNPNAWTFAMGGNGSRIDDPAISPMPSSPLSSFVPLTEATAPSGVPNTTQATAFSLKTSDSYSMLGNSAMPLFFVNTGQNGLAYNNLQKGTAAYNAGLSVIQAAYNLAAKPFIIGCIIVSHGESDQANPQYGQNLIQWQKDYQADIQAITKQVQPIPFIMTQTANWQANGTGGVATPTAAALIANACIANPGVLINAGPSYQYPYFTGDGLGIHFNGYGQSWRGEMSAKAYRKYLQSGDFQPLRPLTAQRTGAQILVTFLVPVAPLVIDTVHVVPPTNFPGSMYGFEFVDGSATPPTITNVQITSPTQVTITLSAAPTGATPTLRYAWTGIVNNYSGPTTGPRGNLRDSDPMPSLRTFTLANWCIAFSMPTT